jgi:hypothetical protein
MNPCAYVVAEATTHKSSYFFRSLFSLFGYELCQRRKIQMQTGFTGCGKMAFAGLRG